MQTLEALIVYCNRPVVTRWIKHDVMGLLAADVFCTSLENADLP